MRHLALVILCFSLLAGCEKHEDPAKLKAAIGEMDGKFVQAFMNEDLDAMMALFWNSPDVVAFYPDGDFKGYDAVKESWKRSFDSSDTKNFAMTESHIEVMPHAVSDWGMWTYTFQPKNGPEMTMNGRYSQLWVEKNGKWVMTVQHASLVTPPPPAQVDEKMKSMKK